jgi:hypothetical protein
MISGDILYERGAQQERRLVRVHTHTVCLPASTQGNFPKQLTLLTEAQLELIQQQMQN